MAIAYTVYAKKNRFLHISRGIGITSYSLLYVYCCNIAK